jgi:osmotically-inducible protein OsmY
MKNVAIGCVLICFGLVAGCQTRSPKTEATVSVQPSQTGVTTRGTAVGATADTYSTNRASVMVDRRSDSAALYDPATTSATGFKPADNTAVNARDRSTNGLTATDQGTSASDREITRQVRRTIAQDKQLSFTAKNIKVITINGKVTLKGPVRTPQEREIIAALAQQVSGVAAVDNQLETTSAK